MLDFKASVFFFNFCFAVNIFTFAITTFSERGIYSYFKKVNYYLQGTSEVQVTGVREIAKSSSIVHYDDAWTSRSSYIHMYLLTRSGITNFYRISIYLYTFPSESRWTIFLLHKSWSHLALLVIKEGILFSWILRRRWIIIVFVLQ